MPKRYLMNCLIKGVKKWELVLYVARNLRKRELNNVFVAKSAGQNIAEERQGKAAKEEKKGKSSRTRNRLYVGIAKGQLMTVAVGVNLLNQ